MTIHVSLSHESLKAHENVYIHLFVKFTNLVNFTVHSDTNI